MALLHLFDEDGDDTVIDVDQPDDESDADFGIDPYELLADREERIGTPLYWQTDRRIE